MMRIKQKEDVSMTKRKIHNIRHIYVQFKKFNIQSKIRFLNIFFFHKNLDARFRLI